MSVLNAFTIGLAYLVASPTSQQPQLQDVYWGPGQQPSKLDESVQPFNISFSREMIQDLRMRLKNTRKFQPPLENTGWTYGISGDYMPKIVQYWLYDYDFKAREHLLNRYPQFVTNIQGLKIHMQHVKPQLPNGRKVEVVPLLLLHGWPGSVVEFQKIMPMLTTVRPNENFVFEVIAPSLPGFGYSDAASKAGLGAVEMAHLMKNLMLRLGFNKFYVQGGDWGSVITANLASMYPQHVLGLHSNLCHTFNLWTWLKMVAYGLAPSLVLPEDERKLMYPLSKTFYHLIEESGYLHEQATKPDTIGVGTSDSPAGLAAYVLEKFSTATNRENRFRKDGNLLEKFTMDELLDNLMFYWAPNKATSSYRIYAETFNKRALTNGVLSAPIKVPSACAQFPHEIIFQSAVFLRDRYLNLVRVTKMPRGGHFAALEEPQLLADDIWAAVRTMRDGSATKKT